MLFGHSFLMGPLLENEDSTTSIGADLAELNSEGETPEPEVTEVEEHEEEVEVPEGETPEVGEQEEEQEEVPELVTHPFDRPTIKQLNEVYPDLFKKFPSLRDMYFREAEYTKVFPTIDDAKEALENNEAFTSIREDVFKGTGEKFLNAIKEVNEKDLERFSSQFLGTLFKVSPTSFWRVANPLVEDIARNMFEKGVKSNDEVMQNSAKSLSEYFFGTSEVAEGKRTTVQKIETDPEISKERENLEKERDTDFRGKIETDIRSQILQMIEAKDSKTGKSRLDPDNVFSTFIKTTIIDSIIRDLGTQLVADKDHIRFMDSLWAKARRAGRTEADKARIVAAYLARAKSLIPSLRSKYVSEALGQKVRTSTQKKEKSEIQESRRDGGTQGRNSNGREKSYNPRSINYNKTSDEDILNDNITYK